MMDSKSTNELVDINEVYSLMELIAKESYYIARGENGDYDKFVESIKNDKLKIHYLKVLNQISRYSKK